jgi:A/G-specific adenine glycosylase
LRRRGSAKRGHLADLASAVEQRDVADRLLEWFRPEDRLIPWRHSSDPYRVWVGEVMAQQTRIPTVLDYYDRFLTRFPTLSSLADSSLDDVLKAWEGMGYYGRARNLRSAAREVMAAHGGRLPEEPTRLRQLPGIGPYTAGAIASLAFGRDEPAVDGNVRRVLSRLFDISRPTARRLEAAARTLIEARPGRAAALNQALMDLGSGCCTARAPDCETCPLSRHCLALARGVVADRPPTTSRRRLPHQTVGVGVVWRETRVLIARRPPSGLLGGLWEFPGGKLESGESAAAAVKRELWEEVGVEVRVGALIDRVDHAYSHFRVTLHFHEAEYLSGRARPRVASEVRWVEPGTLGEYAFPAASHAIVDRVRSTGRLEADGRTPDGA